MDWQKIKEKLLDHIVTLVLSLVASLCLIIWQAVPAQAWEQLGAVIPKRALAALIALLLIILGGTVAYIFSLRRANKPFQDKLSASEERITSLTARVAELSSQYQEAEIRNRRLTKEVEELSYQFEFDEMVDKILLAITGSGDYPSVIAHKLELTQTKVEYYLGELEKRQYVHQKNVNMYALTQRSREYLMKKGLI